MTKTKTDNTPATPARTIPAFAVSRFPELVQQANEKAVAAAVAFREGQAKAREARAAANAAPRADANRLAEAVKAGKPAPATTEPDLIRDAETAERVEKVLRGERDRATKELHQAVVDRLPECLQVQAERIADLKSDADSLVADLAAVIADLNMEAAIADGLHRADVYGFGLSGERRLRGLGKLRFDRTRNLEGDALSRVAAALAAFEPVTRSAGSEQAEQERKQAENQAHARQMLAVGEGGVHVA
jgi:hypothetical protein